MKKVIKIISNCLISVLIVILLFLLVVRFISKDSLFKVGDYSFFDVNGNSMSPILKDGDYIAINMDKKDIYEVDDIVAFVLEEDDYKIIVAHKIVEVIENDYYVGYITKGVNNENNDVGIVMHDEIVGEYKDFKIPVLGYVVRASNTNIGYIFMVILPLGVMFTLAMYELLKELNKKKEEK